MKLKMASVAEEEYNKHRRLEILNLPPSTVGEIKDFLSGINVKDIQINEILHSASVTLYFGDQVEECVEKFNGKQLKDNKLIVKPEFNPQLLCVAHIPLSYTNAQFQEFCKGKGPIKYAYVMPSDKTDQNKGYGLVEYDSDPAKVRATRYQLDWSELEGQVLHVDFVDEPVQASFQGLQSKCLFVSGMPDDFTDITRLREIFGCVTSPVYSQIVAKGEKSLGFGIVEFKIPSEAEDTWLEMKDKEIEGNAVTISFCIPGKSAVVINNRVGNKFAEKLKRHSLLPDPVSVKPVIGGNAIYISLIKSYPKLAGEFTSVLAALQQAYVAKKMETSDKPGLLGPAPSMPVSPVMNSDIQLALIVIMAMAFQKAKKEPFYGVLARHLNSMCELEGGPTLANKPSILGDPISGQANVLVNSLMKQITDAPLLDDDGKEVSEPSVVQEKLRHIFKKFVANAQNLNFNQLSSLGQLLSAMSHVIEGLPGPKPPGGGLLNAPNAPLLGPGGSMAGKGASLLGPGPGGMNSMMGNGMNDSSRGGSLLGDGPNLGGKPQSLMGAGPGTASSKLQQQQGQQSAMSNQAIVQAMGLGMGASGMNNLNQTLLGQISQGLMHQIGQNLMYQLSVNQGDSGGPGSSGGNAGGGGGGPGKGLLGDIPNSPGNSMGAGGRNKGQGKSLLGEPPASYKSSQGGMGGMGSMDQQSSWKSGEGRWGPPGGGYESGYSTKSGMAAGGSGGSGMGGGGGGGGSYNDFGGYSDSYAQDMSSSFGGGYGSGNAGGFGDNNDFYSSFQQQYYYQSLGGTWEYGSNYASGSGGYSGSGAMGGGGGSSSNYGMGSGLSGNQASGVNFQQDGSFGKSNSSGLGGQDSGRFGGLGNDGYGGNMGGGGGSGMGMGGMGGGYGGGSSNYGMMRGDGMADNGSYDSYNSNNYGGGGMNDMGGGYGGGSGGGGGGSGASQMGAYSTGMGSFGSGMGGGSGGSGGMGNMSGSGGGGLLDGMGSGGNSFGSGMGMGGGGMGGGGSSGSLLGNYSSSMGGGGSGKSGMSGMGSGGGSMRDQAMMGGGNSYFTSSGSLGGGGGGGGGGSGSSSSGLLPNPGGKFNMTSPGQKRPFSQLMGKGDSGMGMNEYMTSMGGGMSGGMGGSMSGGMGGSMSGGMGGSMSGGIGGGSSGMTGGVGGGSGLYSDSYKRSRLY